MARGGRGSLPLPPPFPQFLPIPLPFPSLPKLEGGSYRSKLPQQVRAEPGRQTHLEARQDSIAIAKKTARCAQYMGALKSFETPHYAPSYCSRNF